MRKLILILFLVPSICFSQTKDPVNYTEVITVENVKQGDLFIRARQWLNESFKSAKDVIQIADKETGELAAKGFTSVSATYHMLGEHKYPVDVWFAINIWVKDGKYKYEIKDFNAKSTSQDLGILTGDEEYPYKLPPMGKKKFFDEVWKGTKEGVQADVNNLITTLKTTMNKKAASDF